MTTTYSDEIDIDLEAKLYSQIHHSSDKIMNIPNQQIPQKSTQKSTPNFPNKNNPSLNRYYMPNKPETGFFKPHAKRFLKPINTTIKKSAPLFRSKIFTPYTPCLNNINDTNFEPCNQISLKAKKVSKKLESLNITTTATKGTVNITTTATSDTLKLSKEKETKLAKINKLQEKKSKANKIRNKKKSNKVDTIILDSSNEDTDDDVILIPIAPPPTVCIDSSDESIISTPSELLPPEKLPLTNANKKIVTNSRCSSPSSSIISDDFIIANDRARLNSSRDNLIEEYEICQPPTVDSVLVRQTQLSNIINNVEKQKSNKSNVKNNILLEENTSSELSDISLEKNIQGNKNKLISDLTSVPQIKQNKKGPVVENQNEKSDSGLKKKKLRKRKSSGSNKSSDQKSSSSSSSSSSSEDDSDVTGVVDLKIIKKNCPKKVIEKKRKKLESVNGSDDDFFSILKSIVDGQSENESSSSEKSDNQKSVENDEITGSSSSCIDDEEYDEGDDNSNKNNKKKVEKILEDKLKEVDEKNNENITENEKVIDKIVPETRRVISPALDFIRLENNDKSPSSSDSSIENDDDNEFKEHVFDKFLKEIVKKNEICVMNKKKSRDPIRYDKHKTLSKTINKDKKQDNVKVVKSIKDDSVLKDNYIPLITSTENQNENLNTVDLVSPQLNQSLNIKNVNSLVIDDPENVWNAEMKSFYNDSWGNDFDIDEIQSKMNLSNWSIACVDRLPKRGLPDHRKRMHCFNCNEKGHLKNKCKMPLKKIVCHMCGEIGHLSPRCPNKICLRCAAPTNVYSLICDNCSSYDKFKCNICRIFGHKGSDCPDTWRRYHSTIQDNKPLVTNVKYSRTKYCSICSLNGHLAQNCRHALRIFNSTPNSSLIYKYTPVYPIQNFIRENNDLNAQDNEIRSNNTNVNTEFKWNDKLVEKGFYSRFLKTYKTKSNIKRKQLKMMAERIKLKKKKRNSDETYTKQQSGNDDDNFSNCKISSDENLIKSLNKNDEKVVDEINEMDIVIDTTTTTGSNGVINTFSFSKEVDKLKEKAIVDENNEMNNENNEMNIVIDTTTSDVNSGIFTFNFEVEVDKLKESNVNGNDLAEKTNDSNEIINNNEQDIDEDIVNLPTNNNKRIECKSLFIQEKNDNLDASSLNIDNFNNKKTTIIDGKNLKIIVNNDTDERNVIIDNKKQQNEQILTNNCDSDSNYSFTDLKADIEEVTSTTPTTVESLKFSHPLPDFISLNTNVVLPSSENSINVVQHENLELINSNNIVQDDHVDVILPENECIAKIFLSKEDSQILLSPSGNDILLNLIPKFKLIVQMEWHSTGNVLCLTGLPSEQNKFQAELLQIIINIHKDERKFKIDTMQLPRNRISLINYIQNLFLLLNVDFGNINLLYKDMCLKNVFPTTYSQKSAEKSRKDLNIVLFGQNGLGEGRTHLIALKNHLKLLKEKTDINVSIEIRTELYQHVKYIFTSYDHDNYKELIDQYNNIKLSDRKSYRKETQINVRTIKNDSFFVNDCTGAEGTITEEENLNDKTENKIAIKSNVTTSQQQQNTILTKIDQINTFPNMSLPSSSASTNPYVITTVETISTPTTATTTSSIITKTKKTRTDRCIPSSFWSKECIILIEKCNNLLDKQKNQGVTSKLERVLCKANANRLTVIDYDALLRIFNTLKKKLN